MILGLINPRQLAGVIGELTERRCRAEEMRDKLGMDAYFLREERDQQAEAYQLALTEAVDRAQPSDTLNGYQAVSQRTGGKLQLLDDRLSCASLGLTGEAGEFADHIKKWVYHNHDLDREALKLELGDILWYVQEAAAALGLTLQQVADANVQKLARRYPNGFTPEDSKARVDTEAHR